jgi:hypothetical protein
MIESLRCDMANIHPVLPNKIYGGKCETTRLVYLDLGIILPSPFQIGTNASLYWYASSTLAVLRYSLQYFGLFRYLIQSI